MQDGEELRSHLYIESGDDTLTSPLVAAEGDNEVQSYQKETVSWNEDDNDALRVDAANGDETDDMNAVGSPFVSRGLLFLVAFLYGTLNVTLRFVYELPDPPSASALSTTRGWLAVLCFLPLVLRDKGNHHHHAITNHSSSSLSLWRIAAELALWNFGAQGLLTLGLLSTPSARASFLTQTSVVMTPVVSRIAGQNVKATVWLGCLCALGGLVLLSDDDNGGVGSDISIGDLIVLSGALCWSLYVFRLSSVGDSYDEIQLQASKTFLLALLYSGWFTVASILSQESLWPGWTSLASWGLIFYSALGPGTLADVIQQKGQAVIKAAEANIILSMEPVFTAILGRVLLGEATSLQEKLGGGLIILAALIATR